MPWLDDLLDLSDSPKPTLVLCRSSASANAVRRHFARCGGQVGMEIMTPMGLARSVEPPRLVPGDDPVVVSTPIPETHPWASVNGRAGLGRILSCHLSDIRAEQIPLQEPPKEVASLLELGLGDDADNRAIRALVERLASDPPLKRLGFDRVFAIGFGNPTAKLPEPPGTRLLFQRILSALDAVHLSAPVRSIIEEGVQTVHASDVAAEAAWVASEVSNFTKQGGNTDDVLVLVAGEDDRDRIYAALARSGIPAAADQAQRLNRHGLVVLLESILPWFADVPSDKVVIDGEALRRLLQNPMTRSGIIPDDEQATLRDRIGQLRQAVTDIDEPETEPEPAAAEDDLHLSRRNIPPTLRECHRINATLEGWNAALAVVSADPGRRFGIRRSALLIQQRLQWLKQMRGPTLGHLRAFLNRLGLHSFKDRVAMSIQAALSDAATRPATAEVLSEVLDGAVASGDIHRGVTLLNYGHYDGRPSDLCLLTGMHSKGVGQAPTPDPFFTNDQAKAWGRIGGTEYLSFLMDQASAGAARAQIAKACIVQRAADGRAVVPVSHHLLRLADDQPHRDPQNELRNYGLGLSMPETSNWKALQVKTQPVPVNGPASGGDPFADHAARMATVEWIRCGGSFDRPDGATGVPADVTTLRDIIGRSWDALPRSLRPYLGDASSFAIAALPFDTTLSATGGFEPLSHCLFQAYLKIRLRLKESEPLEEELDASEVGSAVHKALEHIDSSRWQAEDADAAVKTLTDELVKGASGCLKAMLKGLPDATPALGEARRGLVGRWERHLSMYADARIENPRALAARAGDAVIARVKQTPDYRKLVERAEIDLPVKAHRDAAKPWIPKAVAAIADGSDPLANENFGKKVSGPARNAIAGWFENPEVLSRLTDLATAYPTFLAQESALHGRIVRGETEWAFGQQPHQMSSKPLTLQLGEAACVQVRGSVDRIRVTEGPDGAQAIEFLDYKTGKPFAKTLTRAVSAGTVPQLPVYALAWRASRALAESPAGVSDFPIAIRLGYDFVREASPKGLCSWEPSASPPSLDDSATLLGWLLLLARRGEYPVLPHDLTCPVLMMYGHDYCRFRSVCRFRQHPATPAPTDTDDQPQEETP